MDFSSCELAFIVFFAPHIWHSSSTLIQTTSSAFGFLSLLLSCDQNLIKYIDYLYCTQIITTANELRCWTVFAFHIVNPLLSWTLIMKHINDLRNHSHSPPPIPSCRWRTPPARSPRSPSRCCLSAPCSPSKGAPEGRYKDPQFHIVKRYFLKLTEFMKLTRITTIQSGFIGNKQVVKEIHLEDSN